MPRQPLQRIHSITVARRYFIDRQTKSQIAEALNISRFRVARIIDEAIEQGLVKFVIAEQEDIDTSLSVRLQNKFGLKNALVLAGSTAQTSDAITASLGGLAASLLEEMLQPHTHVGVAWGRVLSATADALTRLPALDVVQIAGAHAGLEFSQNSIDLVHRIASIGKGTPHPIYVPMWVEDESTAKHLMCEPSVSKVLDRYDNLDVLITGIGSWHPPASCLYSTFPTDWRNAALAAGACADICTTIINAEGDVIPSELGRLGLAITAEQIRKVPEVIAIAGGLDKCNGIAAVLKGNWITTLVTDAVVAAKLLEN